MRRRDPATDAASEGDLRPRANRSVMPDLTAKRTLVKSPPELWEELSEVDRLARHLDAFGEIRITKLEPEHTVAWEGEHASGTVSIEPSGWGTKVTLTAELPEAEPPEPEGGQSRPNRHRNAEPVPEEPAPQDPVVDEAAGDELLFAEPVTWEPPPPRRRRGFWAWLFRERTAPQAPVQAEPAPEPVDPSRLSPSRSSAARSSRSRSKRKRSRRSRSKRKRSSQSRSKRKRSSQSRRSGPRTPTGPDRARPRPGRGRHPGRPDGPRRHARLARLRASPPLLARLIA